LEAATVELFKAVEALHTLEFRVFRRPSQYGYLNIFNKRHQSVRCCMNARDAFIPLMALCSYAISLTPDFTAENPSWVAKLQEMGIHPEWVQLLKDSQLADFSASNERLGVIIQPKCKWLNRVSRMVQANVPVYILWDNSSDFSDTPWFRTRYCPTFEEVKEARLIAYFRRKAQQSSWGDFSNAGGAVNDESTLVPDDFTLVPDQQPPTPVQQPPTPDQFSGQRRGETMDQFFARRAARHAQMEATETPADKRSRLDRERAAAGHCIPGRGGARCFTWEEIDGFMMRTYLIRSTIEDSWGGFARSQRRYDSFYNEWDLSEYFDPSAIADDDEDEDDDDDMVFRPMTPPPPPPYPPSPAPPQIFINDISATYRNNTSDSPYHNEVGNREVQNAGRDPLAKLLHWRFGYCWDGHSAYTELPAVPWLDIQKTLTDTMGSIGELQQPAVSTLVTHLTKGMKVPAVLWDLNSANPSTLRENLNSKLIVNPKYFNQTTYYFIQSAAPPSPNDPSWHLVVEDPVTALECCRRDLGPSIVDIARVLLLSGKPFTTCVRPVTPGHVTPSLRRRDPVGLGWRQMGYKGDSRDYAGYEDRRTAFLAQPRGRKAVLEGGIVWRLAINTVEIAQVLSGPSDEVFEYGRAITDTNGEELWDDALSEDELNLICGVYKVHTQSNQTSDSSWWPKQSVWITSGLHVGYWSVACETWFQKRLEAIRDGTATLRTAGEWRSSLRFWRATAPFISHSKRAAAAYLLNEPCDLFD
jgi:hypothetical protein